MWRWDTILVFLPASTVAWVVLVSSVIVSRSGVQVHRLARVAILHSSKGEKLNNARLF